MLLREEVCMFAPVIPCSHFHSRQRRPFHYPHLHGHLSCPRCVESWTVMPFTCKGSLAHTPMKHARHARPSLPCPWHLFITVSSPIPKREPCLCWQRAPLVSCSMSDGSFSLKSLLLYALRASIFVPVPRYQFFPAPLHSLAPVALHNSAPLPLHNFVSVPFGNCVPRSRHQRHPRAGVQWHPAASRAHHAVGAVCVLQHAVLRPGWGQRECTSFSPVHTTLAPSLSPACHQLPLHSSPLRLPRTSLQCLLV
jgi:hypothetical protein